MLELMNNTEWHEFLWVDVMIAERKKKNWSQADLAHATGLTRTTISDYEKCERTEPSVKALSVISKAFGLPADYLPKIAYPFLGNTQPTETKATAKVKTMLLDLPENEQDNAVQVFEMVMKQLGKLTQNEPQKIRRKIKTTQ